MIVALAGAKGGSGKSTTSIAVAAELQARGRRVLLCDADPQGSSARWGDKSSKAGRATPTVVQMGATLYKPDQLPALARGFEWTIIDCPARIDEVQRAAMLVADLVLLPCGPSPMDFGALGESLALIADARKLRPTLRAAVLITRKVSRTAIGEAAREALEATGLPVLRAELGYRIAYQEAPNLGVGVAEHDAAGRAGAEVRALVDELQGMAKGRPAKARAGKGKRHGA